MFREVQEFIERSRDLGEGETLDEAFGRLASGMGYDRFTAWTEGTDIIPPEGGIYYSNYPQEWLAYYTDQGFLEIDPINDLCRQATTPFLWSDRGLTDRFTPVQQAMMDEAADAGITGGVVIPVRRAFDRPGYVNVLAGRNDAGPGAIPRLHNLSIAFYECAKRMAAKRVKDSIYPAQTLSRHEQECLLWLAAGQTVADISVIIGSGERVVRLHVKRAMRKFGVPTRNQAVVQAIVSGQIDP